jgi:hypothetical protein
LYYKYFPSKNEIGGISFDYRYLARKAQFFGETSYSNRRMATLNGMLLYLTPAINIGMVQRYYHQNYYALYANAFGENSEVANENGFFLGGEIKTEEYSCRFYGDIFSFPWLKYKVNAPSEGSEIMAEFGYTLTNADLTFRYKRQEKPQNFSNDEPVISDLQPFINENYRMNVVFSKEGKLKLQSRLEMSNTGYKGKVFQQGYLVNQDIIIQKPYIPVDFVLRIGYFNVPDYSARIYAYERDVLYSFSSQMFYGKGWRWMFMAKYDPAEWMTIYFKIAQSVYPGKQTTGSGLNETNTPHRSEIKFESIIRF